MPEIPSDVRVQASRVPSPRRLLKSLRLTLIRTARIRLTRCRTDAERRWVADVFGALSYLIHRGELELPAHHDPRDQRRVRKSAHRTTTPTDLRKLDLEER
jgi:hypothetical protein